MAAMDDEENGVDHGSHYTEDGSVDLKGNPVLRSKTGQWKACCFIIVYELIERATFYGISFNLIIYLTTKLNQGTVTASNNVTNWTGVVWIMPIFGAYIADAHLGRYRTFMLSSLVCLTAMCLLTLTVSVPSLKPPPCLDVNKENCKQASKLQLGVFFGSLYLLALASAGTKPNIATIGADQFDELHPKEKAQKISFFNWWMFSVCFGLLLASTILVYIQDNVGWSWGYGIPTIGLAIAILIFVVGTPFYRHKLPNGTSPFIRMANVIVAAALNWRLPLPNDPNQLHELELEHYSKLGTFKIESTPSLRFLNKAAIRTDSSNPWRLCTVTQVEETKQIVRMIPILICTFLPNTMAAQSHTLFIKQGTTLDRSMGSHFKVPPASLFAFGIISLLVTIVIYDRIFVKIMQRVTKNPRGITMLQRMGIGLIGHVLQMAVAYGVERHRLDVAKENGLIKNGSKQLPLTIFILLPQFILSGVADAFLQTVNIEFFYDQAPENMKSLGSTYTMTSLGIGNFLSTFILSTVSDITKRQGNGWILNNLNASHLDYFYALLAVMSAVNFFVFLVISQFYVYKAEVSDSIKVLTDELKKKKSKASNDQDEK